MREDPPPYILTAWSTYVQDASRYVKMDRTPGRVRQRSGAAPLLDVEAAPYSPDPPDAPLPSRQMIAHTNARVTRLRASQRSASGERRACSRSAQSSGSDCAAGTRGAGGREHAAAA